MASVCMLMLTGCQEPDEPVVDNRILEITTSNSNISGAGEVFVLTITSDVEWVLSAVDSEGNPVDWIRFDVTEGKGDASVMGTVVQGDRNENRTCTVTLSTKEGDLKKTLTLTQDVFTPEVLDMELSDLIMIGHRLETGASEELVEYGQFYAEVIGAPGENLTDGYIYVTDGKYYLKVETPYASTANVGDNILLETTGGTITKDAAGMCSVELPAEFAGQTEGTPTVEPLFISADAIARYENKLVAVGYSQPKSQSGKGDVEMTTAIIPNGADYTVHIDENASFAVPSGYGQVVGIVVDGKVWPRSAEDLAGLSEAIKPLYDTYAINPISCFFKCESANTFSNGTITNKRTFTFIDAANYSVAGASLSKIGGTDDQTNLRIVTNKPPYETCFVSNGWNIAGSELLFTLPVNQKVYGNLEFAFSVSCGSANTFDDVWDVVWSTDNATWKPVDAVYCTNRTNPEAAEGNQFALTDTNHMANRQVAELYIPESEAVTSGNIYVKLVPPTATANNTLRVNCGFMLNSKPVSTPDLGFDNIIAMENFDRQFFGISTVVGAPVYFMAACNSGPGYDGTTGWTITEGGYLAVYRGCVHISKANGKVCMASPVLAELDEDIPTDIYVSFKAAPSWVDNEGDAHTMIDVNVGVEVLGSGTVGEIEWDAPFKSREYGWHTGKVKITGASSDTQVLIGVTNESAGLTRLYLDELIISK